MDKELLIKKCKLLGLDLVELGPGFGLWDMSKFSRDKDKSDYFYTPSYDYEEVKRFQEDENGEYDYESVDKYYTNTVEYKKDIGVIEIRGFGVYLLGEEYGYIETNERALVLKCILEKILNEGVDREDSEYKKVLKIEEGFGRINYEDKSISALKVTIIEYGYISYKYGNYLLDSNNNFYELEGGWYGSNGWNEYDRDSSKHGSNYSANLVYDKEKEFWFLKKKKLSMGSMKIHKYSEYINLVGALGRKHEVDNNLGYKLFRVSKEFLK